MIGPAVYLLLLPEINPQFTSKYTKSAYHTKKRNFYMYTFCMYVTLSLVLQSCLLKAHFHLNSLLQGRHFTGTSTVKIHQCDCLELFLVVHYTNTMHFNELSRFISNKISNRHKIYVSLRLCVQNQRTKWNFPLNFRTMRKLSELYSGIFQTQSSGCVSGLDHFRNFTNLKILNI